MDFIKIIVFIISIVQLVECDKTHFLGQYQLTLKNALETVTKNINFLHANRNDLKHNSTVIIATGSGVVTYLLENHLGPTKQLLSIYQQQQEILEIARSSEENEPELGYMFYSTQWSWVANFSSNKRLRHSLKPLPLSLLQIMNGSEQTKLYNVCVADLYKNGQSLRPRECSQSVKCRWEISKGPEDPQGISVALRNRFFNFLQIMNCTNIFEEPVERFHIINKQVEYMYREVLTFWRKQLLPYGMRYHVFRKIGLIGISGYTEQFKFLPYLIGIQNRNGSIGIPEDTPDTNYAITAQSATLLLHYVKYCILYGCKVH